MNRVVDIAELRALARLALPIVVVQVGLMFMGVVDTIMVGRVSPQALGAVALGNLYFFATAIFGMGVLLALDPVVSQAVGARDEPAISRALRRDDHNARFVGWTPDNRDDRGPLLDPIADLESEGTQIIARYSVRPMRDVVDAPHVM